MTRGTRRDVQTASNHVHDSVSDRLGVLEQRYTSSRRALVDELARTSGPLSIPEIMQRRKDLPQSSVYRNLSVLEEAGAVRRLVGTDEFSRYELAEDLTEHHHHLVCTGCGAIADFTLPAQVERSIDEAADKIARDTGFTPEHHSLDFLGTCVRCG